MPVSITVRDETTSGHVTDALTLDFPHERVTARELIRSRVYQEVEDYNRRKPDHFRGLVRPADAEQTPNGSRLGPHRRIDWKEQYERALEAFERNGFFILVDDRQVEALDEELTLRHDTRVSFLRLVPLVGG